MRKLGIQSVTRNTVQAILKRNGYDTGPKRGPGTWDEFLKLHAKTMWQCDFFSKKIVSKAGLRDIFVLVFLHVETRRVFITESTYKPDEAWMIEQAEAFIQHTKTDFDSPPIFRSAKCRRHLSLVFAKGATRTSQFKLH